MAGMRDLPNGANPAAALAAGFAILAGARPQEEMRSWEIAVPIWSKVVTMALASVM